MNQRDYDLIVRAAFGESERGEEAFVEEMLRRDPEAKALFEEFSSLQGGLRDLDDVPACQLSTERLRQAILDQGVKPLRRAPFRTFWGIGVATAACLALTFVVFRQQTEAKELADYRASVSKQLSESSARVDGMPSASAPVDDSVPPDAYAIDTTTPLAPDMGSVMESGAKSAVSQPRRAHRRESVSMMTLGSESSKDKTPVVRDMAVAETAKSKAGEYATGNVPMADAAKFDAAVPEGPVVFVQPQTDPQTGASLAVETNHASDFVFGG